MYHDKILKYKKDIVEYLRSVLPNEDEPIEILDVFRYDGKRSLRLTHFGYRNLKDKYTFFELEFDFENNIAYYSTLDRLMTQPYYLTVTTKQNRAILRTTDERFMKRFKLYKCNLDKFVKKFHPSLANK